MTESLYDKLSKERKRLQAEGNMADWWSTSAWQLFKAKYLFQAKTPREQYARIAKTLAQYVEGHYPDWWVEEYGEGYTWEQAFFDQMWSGNLSGSTPVVSNTGTTRGLTVSCSGNVIPDDIYDIYNSKTEVAVLTKHGFGTASYLGDVRPRGSITSRGVVSSGVIEILKGFVADMNYVSQGSNRRGAWAGYLPIDHGDFYEVVHYLKEAPDGLNIGWNVSQAFIDRLDAGDEEALDRFKTAMTTKMLTGKGYFFFPDKVNARRPQMYKDKGLFVVAAQLCNEIHLHSSEDLTYTCVLSSMNASRWDAWKDTKAAFTAHVFLDCVNEDFIRHASGIRGLEKAVESARLGRPLGLGVCGFHTYLQKKLWAFDSVEAYNFNNELFKHLQDETLKASQWMAQVFGEPEWCKGYGVRNTHRTAVAPTKSSALLMAGISEGINPDVAMTFLQLTPAGEIDRANPVLLDLMKERGVYDKKHMQELTDAQGSVQNVSWLNEEEKLAFRTAFEIPQSAIIKLAAARQRFLCQGQSLNLFFSGEEDESYIAEVHAEAFHNPLILGLYYAYSKSGVVASKGECASCQ
jgi:ribonucleoside-diphosphate reductase alpha chain